MYARMYMYIACPDSFLTDTAISRICTCNYDGVWKENLKYSKSSMP